MRSRRMVSIIAALLLIAVLSSGCTDSSVISEIAASSSEKPQSTACLSVSDVGSVSVGSNIRTIQTDGLSFGLYAPKVICGNTVWSIGFRPGDDGEILYALYSLETGEEEGRILWLELPSPPETAAQALQPGDTLAWKCSDIVAAGDSQPKLLLNLEYRPAAEETVSFADIRQMQWNLGAAAADGTVDPGITLALGEYDEQCTVSALLVWQDVILLSTRGWNAEDPNYVLACSVTDGSLQWVLDLPSETYAKSASVTAQNQLVILAKSVLPPQQSTNSAMLILADLTQENPAADQSCVSLAIDPFSLIKWPYGTQLPEVWIVGQWGIYSWNTAADELCLRYDFSHLPETLYTHLNAMVGLDEENFLLLYRDSGKPVQAEHLSPKLYVSVEDRITLVVANGEYKDVDTAARQFNNAQSDIWIEVKDYTNRAAAAAGFSSGTEMLQRALVQGEKIDIIAVPNNFSGGLLDPALFLDLYPLIDADSELSRADFVTGVLTACENGDALPTVVPQYNLLTAVGSAAKLGDTPGWTWAQYDTLTAGIPTPLYGFDRATVLHYMVQMGGKSLLDYGNATAHLDTPFFALLLTRAKAYPESTAGYNTQDPKPQFTAGKSLAMIRFVTDFSHIRTDVYNFDGPIVYKGFPTDDGGTGSAFTAGLRLGISANCTDADAAWQFLRQFLLPAYQDELQSSFPLRRDSLQKRAEAAQQPLEYPSLPLYFAADALTEKQQEYWMRGITAEEAQQLVDLIEATDTMFQFDAAVLNILGEESAAFFAGQTAAEAAAAIMQNRVQTYLDEQS